MGSRGAEVDDQSTSDNTPEDVAVLYSWANLQGAKYRDYSASRREYRAQVRYRAAKALLERELKAQAEAESAAELAEREALVAEEAARSHNGQNNDPSRIETLRSVEAAARKAAAERVEAARRTEAATHATVLALRAEREIAEAHASAQQQAMIYAESERRRRLLAGPQPRLSMSEAGTATGAELNLNTLDQKPLFDSQPDGAPMGWTILGESSTERSQSSGELDELCGEFEQTSPAWLRAAQTLPRTPVSQTILPLLGSDAPGGDTLQDSRERVAARWFALKDVFENSGPELAAIRAMRPGEVRTPILAVFSLAGGVGKTSLVATLGRALSTRGEKVLLTDTTSHGLLPFYFGARDLCAGVVREFPPAPQSAGEPISLVIYDAAAASADERHQQMLTEEILRNVTGNHRLLLDLSSGSNWLVRRMADLHPAVLVPIAPNMNSVISLQAVERAFRGITDSEGRPLLPFYVLNQFDAALPLHLDVREVFRRKLGDRLLRFAIRDSPAVSEALAEGTTVLDYAPSAPVSQDFLDIAAWLRSVSPPATSEFRNLRWGEQ